ncbi:MAG: leucine-rich repeat protein [Verrucomicrobiota bacterium]
MTFQKLLALGSVAISIACLSPQQLLAETFGPFTYIDNGDSVTISYGAGKFGKDVVIPATINGKPVTGIGEAAFNGYNKIESVSIPSSVTSIGASAFGFCRGLKSVNIPPGVTTISAGAFSSCYSLAGITIPSGVDRIEARTFEACESLRKITIPGNITEIAEKAFASCLMLEKITIPPSVTTLGDYAFANSGLRSIVIPPTVTTMGDGVFFNCHSLTEVGFPADIREINEWMFAGCSKLTQLTVPPTVTRIGENAFQRSGLKNVVLNSSLTRIEKGTFMECPNLTMVTIPPGIREIGKNAFADCGNLASALFTGKAPEMGPDVFLGCSYDFKIFIADAAKGYTIPKWHGYRTSVPAEEIAVQGDDGRDLNDGEDSGKFGSLIVGVGSTTKSFTIRNVGPRKLTGLSARTIGANSSDFTVKMLTKSSLAPGKTAKVEILFMPKEKGKRVTQLQIRSSDANENPFDIELSGSGLKLVN